jgi:hypothetical protein
LHELSDTRCEKLEQRGDNFYGSSGRLNAKVLAVITDPPEARRIILHLIKTGVAPPGVEASFPNCPAPPLCASQGRSLSLTEAKVPAAGHRRAESPMAAADLPGCGDSQGTPDHPMPLAEPHPQRRTPQLRAARHARRISLPTRSLSD